MSYTHRRTTVWNSTSANLTTSRSQTDESEQELSMDIAPSTSDLEIALVVNKDKIKGFYLHANGALTVETNSSSAPVQTFALVVNEPIAYLAGGAEANPITTSITKLFVTNASPTATVHLDLRLLVDPT